MALAAACGVLASSKCTIHAPAGEVCVCGCCALTVCVLVFVQFLLLSISVHQLGPPPQLLPPSPPPLALQPMSSLCCVHTKPRLLLRWEARGRARATTTFAGLWRRLLIALLCFLSREILKHQDPSILLCFGGLCLWWPSCCNANTAQVASCKQPVCGVSLCVPCEGGLSKQRCCDCVLVHGTVELAK